MLNWFTVLQILPRDGLWGWDGWTDLWLDSWSLGTSEHTLSQCVRYYSLCMFQCSATCGGGHKQRQVLCQDREGVEDDRCEHADRPGQVDSCNQEPCPAWNFGEWGKVIFNMKDNSILHIDYSVTGPAMVEYLTAWCAVKTILGRTCLTSNVTSTQSQEAQKPATNMHANHSEEEDTCGRLESGTSAQNSVAREKGLAQSNAWTFCQNQCQWWEINFALEGRSQRKQTIAIENPVLLFGRLVIGHRWAQLSVWLLWNLSLWENGYNQQQCLSLCLITRCFLIRLETICSIQFMWMQIDVWLYFIVLYTNLIMDNIYSMAVSNYYDLDWEILGSLCLIFISFPQCSHSCGHGMQTRRVTCHRVNIFNWIYPERTDVTGCSSIERPKGVQTCHNLQDCEAELVWVVGSWSEVSIFRHSKVCKRSL